MTVVWSPRAIDHLADLHPILPARTLARRPARLGHYSLRSIAWRRCRISDVPVRCLGLVSSSFRAHGTSFRYRVRGERLEIIAVFHGRQRWPKRL